MKLVMDDGSEIPVKDVRVLNVRDGDVLVLRLPAEASGYAYKRIHDQAREVFGDHVRVVVLENGIELEVVRDE